jgi:hypothetical protein
MIVHNNLRRDNPWREGSTTNMHWYDLYEALGLNPKKHLPAEGLSARQVGNVTVWVDPKIPGTNQDAKRVWCFCPVCQKKFTAGKLFQHMRVHRK